MIGVSDMLIGASSRIRIGLPHWTGAWVTAHAIQTRVTARKANVMQARVAVGLW